MAQTLEAPVRKHVQEEHQPSQTYRSAKALNPRSLMALAAWAGLVALTVLSWSTEGLFFRELLSVTGILTLIGFVHLMAIKNEPTRNSQSR